MKINKTISSENYKLLTLYRFKLVLYNNNIIRILSFSIRDKEVLYLHYNLHGPKT